MKKLFFLFLLVMGLQGFAQTAGAAKEVFEKIKRESKIDGNDKTVYHVLDEFYAGTLQADNDGMLPETIENIQKLTSDPETRNLHILMLFLMYQQHISQTEATGKKPNTEFQIEMVKLLEDEIKKVYGKTPALIYVYQYEALNAGNRKDEAKMVALQGLKSYPDSIPLKVYVYLSTNNAAIKDDLVNNHSSHWMVKQFGIK